MRLRFPSTDVSAGRTAAAVRTGMLRTALAGTAGTLVLLAPCAAVVRMAAAFPTEACCQANQVAAYSSLAFAAHHQLYTRKQLFLFKQWIAFRLKIWFDRNLLPLTFNHIVKLTDNVLQTGIATYAESCYSQISWNRKRMQLKVVKLKSWKPKE